LGGHEHSLRLPRLDRVSLSLATVCLAMLAGCTAEIGEPDGEEITASREDAEVSYNPGTGWNLDWSDEFNGTSLNTANWTALTSNYDPVTNNCNFGTDELEYPRASNVTVGGGKLIISAQRTSASPSASQCTAYGGRQAFTTRMAGIRYVN
jgi:beta-glucanase (GH16 family)